MVTVEQGTLADVCSDNRDLLVADPDVGKGDYDRIVDIDLDSIRPRVNGPFTPDLSVSGSTAQGV